MKKWFLRTAAAFLAAAVFILPAAAVPSVSADSFLLMDGDTGAVLAEKNADRQSLIASTTKIMTAVVILEHMPLDQIVEVPEEAVKAEGSSMYLKAGEKLSVESLLYGMLLESGNDAADALAMVCAGSLEEFSVLMNLKAQKLGLSHTRFENPSGLDGKNQYSTARDLAELTRSAMEYPDFRRIVSTKAITFEEHSLKNHNRLLWTLDGCTGVKTGYTKAAGRILVSSAERSGRKLIAVTIRDGNDWEDHKELMEYGFSCYKSRKIAETGEKIGEIQTLSGEKATLLSGENLDYFLSDNDRIKIIINYPRMAAVAGEPGTQAGFATVYVGSRKIGILKLIWGDET